MNVKVEDISSVKKKLSFEVSVEKVDAAIEKAYQKIGKTAKIKGFRQGKVPRSVLERHYAGQMSEEVLGRLINDSYFKAIVEHRIPAIADPEIVDTSLLEKGQPFSYEAYVEIKPEIEPKDYKGLSLKKEKFVLDPKVVEDRLQEMLASRSQLEVTSRKKARQGDFVTIDFEGFLDGVPFEGGKAEGHVLELGSGSFIPGFEEKIEGMKREDEKEFEITFPENYGNKDLAGKLTTFKVAVKEIKEKVLPKADDDFAKEFGLETLSELKEKIEEVQKKQELQRIDEDLKERLISSLVDRNPVEIPEAMLSRQLAYMKENVQGRLKQQGMSLEMLGMNDEIFNGQYKESAVQQVQGSLILEAISLQENLKVEDNEIDGKLEEISAMVGADLERVRQHYAGEDARRNLISQIAEEKVIRFLLDNATIEEVDAKELQEKEKTEEKE